MPYNYPPYNKIRTTSEMKKWYEKARNEINDYRSLDKVLGGTKNSFNIDDIQIISPIKEILSVLPTFLSLTSNAL